MKYEISQIGEKESGQPETNGISIREVIVEELGRISDNRPEEVAREIILDLLATEVVGRRSPMTEIHERVVELAKEEDWLGAMAEIIGNQPEPTTTKSGSRILRGDRKRLKAVLANEPEILVEEGSSNFDIGRTTNRL